LLPKADIAGLVKVTLFSAYDMKKSAKKFQFILDISPLDYILENVLKQKPAAAESVGSAAKLFILHI
ncbi:hypothetical protein, partial [Anaerostipes hominis (ex Liu et al. 2021)]